MQPGTALLLESACSWGPTLQLVACHCCRVLPATMTHLISHELKSSHAVPASLCCHATPVRSALLAFGRLSGTRSFSFDLCSLLLVGTLIGTVQVASPDKLSLGAGLAAWGWC